MTDPEGGSPNGEGLDRRDATAEATAAEATASEAAADERGAADQAAVPPEDADGTVSDPGPTEPRLAAAPAEPTLRANPAVREFDVPFDTGQLEKISTGQLLIVHRPGGDLVEAADEQTQRRVFSWVAAVFGTIGAIASLFVGWMLPLSIVAIVFGVLGLRREAEGRVLAFVGIGTGLAGLVFSAVWIGYYAIVFGALPN